GGDMHLYTAEQAAELARTPYRTLLDWVTAGLFTPKILGGSEAKRILLFSDDDIWEIKWFNQIKHRFERDEWKAVAKAIHEMRRQGKSNGYIGAIGEPGSTKPVRFRPVESSELGDITATGALICL